MPKRNKKNSRKKSKGSSSGNKGKAQKVKPLTPQEAEKIILEAERQEAAKIIAELNLDLKNQGVLTKDEIKKVLASLDVKTLLEKNEKIELSELGLGLKEVTRIEVKK